MKNVAAFSSCSKNCLGAKWKSLRLMALTEESSRQPRFDFVTWPLLDRSMMKKSKLSKKIQNAQFEEKRITRKFSRAKHNVQGDKKLKSNTKCIYRGCYSHGGLFTAIECYLKESTSKNANILSIDIPMVV